MHPYVALALCLCLVAALFVLDRKWRPKMSAGEWIALLWALIIGSRPVTTWFDPSHINSLDALVEGTPLDRALFLFLIVAGVMVLFTRRFDWLRFATTNKSIILYFAYLGIGVLWSDYSFIAFKRWIKDLGNLVMVLVILSQGNPYTAVKALLVRTSYVLVPLSVVLVKYFPDISRSYDFWTARVYFSGVGTTKNMLGMTLTALALAHLWALIDAMKEHTPSSVKMEIGVHIALLLMIAWLLALADCATALACIAVGAMTLLLLRVRSFKKHIGLWLILALLAGTLFAIPDVRTFIMEPIVGLLGRDISLTDRDDVWRVLLQQDINPLIGAGSYSFWMGERVAGPLPGLSGWANTAHNAYLEIYLNVGLVGLALYLLILATGTINVVRDMARGKRDNGEDFRLTFLIATVLYGVTEAVVRLNLLWFGLLLVVARFYSSGRVNPQQARDVSANREASSMTGRPEHVFSQRARPGKAPLGRARKPVL